MENNLPELLKQSKGRYLLINVVSRRIKQLISGERQLVRPSAVEGRDYLITAMKEIKEGKLSVKAGKMPKKIVDLVKSTEG